MEAYRGSSNWKLQLPYFLSLDFRYLWQKFQWGLEKESKEKVSVLSCTWSETRRGKRRASALDVIGQGKRCCLLTRWCTRRLIAWKRKLFQCKSQLSAMFLSYAQSTRAHTTIFFSSYAFPPQIQSNICVLLLWEKKQCDNTCDQSCIGAALIVMLPIIFARLRSVFFFFFSVHALNACNKHCERCISPLVWEVLKTSLNI